MSFFDDIARAAIGGGFNVQSFSGPGYESVWSQLKPWLGRITTAGVVKWIPRAASQLPCGVPLYEHGLPVAPCASHALDTCLCCGRPVCLHHAFVDGSEATVVCFLCVVQMKAQLSGAAQPAPQKPPHQERPKPPDPKEAALQKAWWARGVLFVQEGASWPSIKKQYKTLSAQNHPDRSGGDENRFKEIQSAYDILKLIYGEN